MVDIDVSNHAEMTAWLEANERAGQEIDEIEALQARRLSLRIRRLELGYQIGKIASSEGGAAPKVEEVRHYVAGLDQEIQFLDAQIRGLLDAYTRRTGPWLILRYDDERPVLWFVSRKPCLFPDDAMPKPQSVHLWPNVVPISEFGFLSHCVPLQLDVPRRTFSTTDLITLEYDGNPVTFALGD